jgi:hypothetical protein
MTKDLGVWTADDGALTGASAPETVLVFAFVVGLAVSGPVGRWYETAERELRLDRSEKRPFASPFAS